MAGLTYGQRMSMESIMTGAANHSFWMALIVDKRLYDKDLNIMFRNAAEDEIILFVGTRQTLNELKTKSRLNEEQHVMLVRKAPLPLDNTSVLKDKWLLELLVVPFVACLLHTTFKNITLHFHTKITCNSILNDILIQLWPEYKEFVLGQVRKLLEHHDRWLCVHCTKDCDLRLHQWHWGLEGFDEEAIIQQDNSFNHESIDLFRGNGNPSVKIMATLKRYCQMGGGNLNVIERYISRNARGHVGDYWTSYLVVVVDGPAMHQNANLSFEGLLSQADVRKGVYAGCCKNRIFRDNHFCRYPQSSILGKIVSTTSKIFLLRKKRFRVKDRALADEAKMIAVCQHVKHEMIRTETTVPFAVLNQRNMIRNMGRIGQAGRAEVMRFLASGTPVIYTPGNNAPIFRSTWFRGNCKARYIHKDYSEFAYGRTYDEVEHLYKKFEYK